jgi:hypothetical protein
LQFAGLLDRVTRFTPDVVARRGMRSAACARAEAKILPSICLFRSWMLWDRLREYHKLNVEDQQEWTQRFVDGLKKLVRAIRSQSAFT